MKSLEAAILTEANCILQDASRDVLREEESADARLSVLENAASRVGGWDVHSYRALNGTADPRFCRSPEPWVDKLLRALAEVEIPIPLSLSALAREEITPSRQRTTGAYYTDWRLAQMLAGDAVPMVASDGIWVDPACGTGSLLVATAMAVTDDRARDDVIREKLTGADLSERALRGARLAVSSMTSDLDVVAGFAARLIRQDSLRSADTWRRLAPKGTALVIGNPPWEKLRVSKHELAKSMGVARHYGQGHLMEVDVTQQRRAMVAYVDAVASGMRLQGTGEHDLYKLFLELGIGISAEGGVLAILLPAGLVRSQGTEQLRRELYDVSSELSITVMENRARHFAIDTRFKFVALTARIGGADKQPIALRVADRAGTLSHTSVRLSRSDIRSIRPDLTVPEVRTSEEWALFRRLAQNATTLSSPGPWAADYRREVDMTLDRRKFTRAPAPGTVPVLEGRHVAQYRWRAKSYIKGEGRAALWTAEPMARARVKTQWHMPTDLLDQETRSRLQESRVGLRDISGQTNERTLLVARVPAGYVCGNKVPTLVFDGGVGREDLFIALANSFVVDWLLRRLVTTTVNYFLLKTLPLPNIDETTEVGRLLVRLSRKIQAAEGDAQVNLWKLGTLRAEVDALVAAHWGLSVSDMSIILADFPLLDRGQPSIAGESRSTITTDSVLSALARYKGIAHPSINRVAAGRRLGSVPYIPAEYAKEDE